MTRWICITIGLAALSGVNARAQDSKWAIGPHLVFSFPQEEFANVSRTGEGLGGKLLYRFPGFVSVVPRLDVGFLSYGEKRNEERIQRSGYFIVTTRNESFQVTLGPQFSQRIGRVTPYFAPMGGLYVYRTVVSIPDLYYYYGIPAAETTDSLTRLGWNINGGIMIDIGLGPHIDIGFKYQTIPNAVETETEVEGESVRIKSDATDFIVSIGVVFYLKND